jgi:miniconductance mechanosensitive channel
MNMTLNWEQKLAEFTYDWVIGIGVDPKHALWVKLLLLLGLLLVIVWLIGFVTRRMVQSAIKAYSKRIQSVILDTLVEHQTFKYISRILPLSFAMISIPVVLHEFGGVTDIVQNLIGVLMIITLTQFIQSFLKFVKQILLGSEAFKDKPIAAYVQVASIIVNLLAILVAVSVLTDRSLLSLFTAVGAMSAVLLLIFKDTLAGLAASIRISSSDMLRNGDRIEFLKYGADGNVIDINLVNVKVRNFDNTYTTVPTAAFTADSFKNWRGMEESDGRLIKRSIFISQHTVHFASESLLNRFSKHPLLKSYIEEKRLELEAHNTRVEQEGKGESRHLTNLGLFRIYLTQYLMQLHQINLDMTLVVRQLAPSEKGVPLEIFCYTKFKNFLDYEKLQSDIFDHVFACIKDFELEVFENPRSQSNFIA